MASALNVNCDRVVSALVPPQSSSSTGALNWNVSSDYVFSLPAKLANVVWPSINWGRWLECVPRHSNMIQSIPFGECYDLLSLVACVLMNGNAQSSIFIRDELSLGHWGHTIKFQILFSISRLNADRMNLFIPLSLTEFEKPLLMFTIHGNQQQILDAAL